MNDQRPLTIIESPYAGDIPRNVAYAKACMKDCIARGEQPFCGHLLYTQVLDDGVPEERALGISFHLRMALLSEELKIYTDLGISPGMQQAIAFAKDNHLRVEYRTVPNWICVPDNLPEIRG